jgi:CBS domain containing-hemolysin-like protein
MDEGHYIFDSKVLVSEVNDLLGLEINDEDVDTMGGWVLTENYEAKQGDSIQFDSYDFTILEMEDHHIKYIEVKKLQEQAQPIEQQAEQMMLAKSEVLS